MEVIMFTKRETTVPRKTAPRDPFALLRSLATPFDRMFEAPDWPGVRWPLAFDTPLTDVPAFRPAVDVFEKDGRLVTKIDLPGMKKDDVTVEVADRHLIISGERRSELEEKQDAFYRCEREYGSFYRAVPLPEGVKLEDVKATFADGVLEVSVPMPAKATADVRRVEIETPTPVKAA
jgi:HSP20 family protein